MDRIKELCMVGDNLIDWLSEKSCGGTSIEDSEDVEVMGAVIDMIKDIAEAKEENIEAKYYKTVVEAMEKGQEKEDEYIKHTQDYRADHRSTIGGGHGSVEVESRSHSAQDDGRISMWDGMPEEYDPRYGKAYNDYKQSKKHYMTTKAEQDKKEMEQHTEKHMNNVMTTVKEIYRDAVPEMKAKLKNDLTKFMAELV